MVIYFLVMKKENYIYLQSSPISIYWLWSSEKHGIFQIKHDSTMNLLFRIIHCIVKVRKHLVKLHPTALLRGESSGAGSPGLCHFGFGCFQACRLHHLSRKPVPLLSHPHSNFPPLFCLNRFSCISHYAHCLLSYLQVSLSRACVHLLSFPLPAINIHQ